MNLRETERDRKRRRRRRRKDRKTGTKEAGAMAPHWRVLAVLAEEWYLIPSVQAEWLTTTCNSSFTSADSSDLQGYLNSCMCVCVCARAHTHTHTHTHT